MKETLEGTICINLRKKLKQSPDATHQLFDDAEQTKLRAFGLKGTGENLQLAQIRNPVLRPGFLSTLQS